MPEQPRSVAIDAATITPRTPTKMQPFAAKTVGREKRALGAPFGLTNFGANLVRLRPGAVSALRHAHSRQDELVYVIEGEPTVITDAGETPLRPGMCVGFKAGTGDAHHIVNRSEADAVYLEVGDRSFPDHVTYPEDDVVAESDANGVWRYTKKDGTLIVEP
ncbi:MAG TPA: cupin domain-containing protein [Stellaceae bacterium]|nr:cupin domain-containing protein [Stellaceae bacterium]